MHAGALSQGNPYCTGTKGPSAVLPAGQQMAFYRGEGPYRLPDAMSADDIAQAIEVPHRPHESAPGPLRWQPGEPPARDGGGHPGRPAVDDTALCRGRAQLAGQGQRLHAQVGRRRGRCGADLRHARRATHRLPAHDRVRSLERRLRRARRQPRRAGASACFGAGAGKRVAP
ncbi:hypothetical protein G6F57_019696 [Rhizopus arrhizus]|nr:hypothetical protein G6F57_019696 [Rhizopus arrhizus]